MNREDFRKLVGADFGNPEYLPVACLLHNGYACAGYYHAAVNDGLEATCVLLNARLIQLAGENRAGARPSIADFNEFLEEIVLGYCEAAGDGSVHADSDTYGKSIPLTAVAYDEIAVVYPVAHISALLRRAEQHDRKLPRFLDLDKSEIVKLLRTKLW